MNQTSKNRKELLQYINEVSFAVDDAKLFLDTHPYDQNARKFLLENNQKRNQALLDYAAAYGPLTISSVNANDSDHWTWIHEPWPWQEGGC